MAVGSSGVGSPGRRSVTLFSSTWSWRVDPSPTDGGGLGRSGAERSRGRSRSRDRDIGGNVEGEQYSYLLYNSCCA